MRPFGGYRWHAFAWLGWGYLTAVALGAAFWVPQLAHVMRPLYQHKAS